MPERRKQAHLDKEGYGAVGGCSLPRPLPEFLSLLPVCHEVSNLPAHRLPATMIFYLTMGPETQHKVNTDTEALNQNKQVFL